MNSSHLVKLLAVSHTPIPQSHSSHCLTTSLTYIPTLTKKSIGLHGDGVPFTKKKSVEVFSWNFVAEPDADRFLATVIEKEFLCQCGSCHGRHTTDKVLELLCWSFR